MNLVDNPVVLENLSNVFLGFILGFVFSFLLTPLVAKLAHTIDVIDLPAKLRGVADKTASRRIHKNATPKLGGLAMIVAFFISFIILRSIVDFNQPEILSDGYSGILVGLFLIGVLGFMDDKLELSGKMQLLGQFGAAFFAVTAINPDIISQISIYGNSISLEAFTFNIFGFDFIFPGHLIMMIWIVGLINAVNWVGGVDGLNISVSSIASATLLLFVFNPQANVDFDLVLAILIAIHIGVNVGLLPYNYNPAKIFPGSIGDFMNGYLLAVFAILGSAKWVATFILLAIPIVDAILVVVTRMRRHPEVLRNPLKVLSISDKSHLHHRLLAIGYSPKAVTLVESTMMLVLCSIAVFFALDRPGRKADFTIASVLSFTFISLSFSLIYVMKNKAEFKKKSEPVDLKRFQRSKEAVVKVVIEDTSKEEDEDYERFVY